MKWFRRSERLLIPIPVPQKTPFELRIDGVVVGKYATYEEALDNTPDYEREGREAYEKRYRCNWDISERLYGRLFNKAFGYRPGTTSTADMACMGVPIAPQCISNDK
jgi:hypothetical protein